MRARTLRGVQDLVEEQVRRWRLEQWENDKRKRREGEVTLETRPDVLAVAADVGARGSSIARLVGEELHVPVYDRDVVQHIADTAHVHVATIETLDERARGRLDDYIASLFRERSFDRTDYLRMLSRTIVALCEHGPCVVVGHGAVHIVERRHALLVRVVAPEADRVRRLMEREILGYEDARRELRRIDAERTRFHERCFHATLADPLQFDLIVNSSTLGVEASARLVAEAYRRRFTPAVAPRPAA